MKCEQSNGKAGGKRIEQEGESLSELCEQGMVSCLSHFSRTFPFPFPFHSSYFIPLNTYRNPIGDKGIRSWV